MKLCIYSVFDVKAGAYVTPFFLPNEAMAVRAFEVSCNDDTHMFSRHPEDFALYELGSFDDVDGEVTTHYPPRHVINAAQAKKQEALPLFDAEQLARTVPGVTNEVSDEAPVQRSSKGGNSEKHVRS